MKPQGKKEVAEAVLIAALSALVGGLIQWGIDTQRERAEKRKKKKTDDDDHNSPS